MNAARRIGVTMTVTTAAGLLIAGLPIMSAFAGAHPATGPAATASTRYGDEHRSDELIPYLHPAAFGLSVAAAPQP
jgi:hypothetical protein